jgi:hypothetical protein
VLKQNGIKQTDVKQGLGVNKQKNQRQNTCNAIYTPTKGPKKVFT